MNRHIHVHMRMDKGRDPVMNTAIDTKRVDMDRFRCQILVISKKFFLHLFIWWTVGPF